MLSLVHVMVSWCLSGMHTATHRVIHMLKGYFGLGNTPYKLPFAAIEPPSAFAPGSSLLAGSTLELEPYSTAL